MLQLREEQITAFDAVFEEELITRLAERVSAVWPGTAQQAGLPLRDAIRYGIRRARGYGLSTDYEISCFVDLMFAVAPDFDGQQWAREVLGSASLAGWLKAKLLIDRAARMS